jgi:hypothetical protein
LIQWSSGDYRHNCNSDYPTLLTFNEGSLDRSHEDMNHGDSKKWLTHNSNVVQKQAHSITNTACFYTVSNA